MSKIRILCISDTHGLHNEITDKIKNVQIDILIHAGDFTEGWGINDDKFKEFIDWMDSIPAKYKFLISGNHDICLDMDKDNCQNRLNYIENTNIVYLQNNSKNIEINGKEFLIVGIPNSYQKGHSFYQKMRGNWAFGYGDEEIGNIYKPILDVKNDNLILITHEPPYGIMDCVNDNNLGSKELLEMVHKIKPRLHVFGHIHSERGFYRNEHTLFVNASRNSNNDKQFIVELN